MRRLVPKLNRLFRRTDGNSSSVAELISRPAVWGPAVGLTSTAALFGASEAEERPRGGSVECVGSLCPVGEIERPGLQVVALGDVDLLTESARKSDKGRARDYRVAGLFLGSGPTAYEKASWDETRQQAERFFPGWKLEIRGGFDSDSISLRATRFDCQPFNCPRRHQRLERRGSSFVLPKSGVTVMSVGNVQELGRAFPDLVPTSEPAPLLPTAGEVRYRQGSPSADDGVAGYQVEEQFRGNAQGRPKSGPAELVSVRHFPFLGGATVMVAQGPDGTEYKVGMYEPAPFGIPTSPPGNQWSSDVLFENFSWTLPGTSAVKVYTNFLGTEESMVSEALRRQGSKTARHTLYLPNHVSGEERAALVKSYVEDVESGTAPREALEAHLWRVEEYRTPPRLGALDKE